VWLAPFAAAQVLDPGVQPLTVRASTVGALVWFAGALLIAAWAWGTVGYAVARWRQTGRRHVQPVLWALLALFVAWVLIPGMDAGDDPFRPPLITLRVAEDGLLIWPLLAALITPPLLIATGWAWQRRRGQQARTAQLQTLLRDQLAEGVVLVDGRLRPQWANHAARKHFLHDDQIDAAVEAILKRAQATQRIAAQSVTINEARIHVQAVPLAEGMTSVITRQQETDNSPTQFYERFMRRIVHDMRNPLAAIIAHASNLQTATLHDYATTKRTASTIETEAQRLTRLVDSILFDARLSHMPLVLGRHDLVDILEEVYYQHDERAEMEKKTLEIEAPPDPMPLDVDRDLLVRAISNLVDNSLKYSPTGTRIRIVSERTPEHYIIRIVDDGEGIPPEYLPDRIFEPLVRVKPREGVTGSGLGLSIVKKIAQMHGGAVSVESALGRGTTMTLVLPRPAA
jgi:signal transduction histidine kinase